MISIEKEQIPIIRSSTYGGGTDGINNSMTLNGLTNHELERMQSMLLGGCWVRVNEFGRLETRDPYAKLPDPIDDPALAEYWQMSKITEETRQENYLPLHFSTLPSYGSPHFLIQHLCGYGYTKERYKIIAQRLESYGFQCLRSKRGNNGRFWEVWYLPGLWAAKGELAETFNTHKEKFQTDQETVDKVLRFLMKNTSFGTLDVSIQRLGMCSTD